MDDVIGPAPGAQVLDALALPPRPRRTSQRRWRELHDSSPLRVLVDDPATGRPRFRATVAGRISAHAVVATFTEHTVTVAPARATEED